MQTAIMILVVLLGTLALPVVAGAVYQAIETWRDRRRFPHRGRLVRFNERRMHIHVTGEGTPTVVFESGMGASCLSWTLGQPQLAQFARAVSYDRAGHGWSDPAREPRTARQIAHELHTLLNATGVPGPCQCSFTFLRLFPGVFGLLAGVEPVWQPLPFPRD